MEYLVMAMRDGMWLVTDILQLEGCINHLFVDRQYPLK